MSLLLLLWSSPPAPLGRDIFTSIFTVVVVGSTICNSLNGDLLFVVEEILTSI